MTDRSRRLFVTRLWPQPVLDHLAGSYDVTVNDRDTPCSREELIEALHEFDILCPVVSDRIDAAMLRTGSPSVRLIASYGVGTDHIDLHAARDLGIRVSNTPDVLTEATAELAITLMLMASRRAGEGEREVRDGRWSGWRPTHLLGSGLRGKTLGLVGYGRIARAVARMAREGFGMRIAYFSRRRAPDSDDLYMATLDDLLRASDIVSLHCPGGPETHHLIDGARLARMKPSAILINTARGTVVDEAMLAAALRNGDIAAAGLDVYEAEPSVHPALLPLENVVLLPHLGSATQETREAMGMRVTANIDAFCAGTALPDRVA